MNTPIIKFWPNAAHDRLGILKNDVKIALALVTEDGRYKIAEALSDEDKALIEKAAVQYSLRLIFAN